MRRGALLFAIAGCLALITLCGVGMSAVRASIATNLVIPGGDDVRVNYSGVLDLHMSYRLPPDQTMHNVQRHFLQHGWNRFRTQEYGRHTAVFARRSWFGVVLDVAVVSRDATDRKLAKIQIGRCFRIRGWIGCP